MNNKLLNCLIAGALAYDACACVTGARSRRWRWHGGGGGHGWRRCMAAACGGGMHGGGRHAAAWAAECISAAWAAARISAAAISPVRVLRMLVSRPVFEGRVPRTTRSIIASITASIALRSLARPYALRCLRQLLAQGVDALWTAMGQRLRRLRLLLTLPKRIAIDVQRPHMIVMRLRRVGRCRPRASAARRR